MKKRWEVTVRRPFKKRDDCFFVEADPSYEPSRIVQILAEVNPTYINIRIKKVKGVKDKNESRR